MLTDRWETLSEVADRTGKTPEEVVETVRKAFQLRQAECRMGYRDGVQITEIRIKGEKQNG